IVVFTGGIGENDTLTRTKSLEGLEFLGIDLDTEKSMTCRAKEEVISKNDSKVSVIVVPTDEELMIATDTHEIVEKLSEVDIF
ncbi:MAG TPA: acetate kinase, partial [Bacteroidales bacterium]|nr:acetate kinase [Bacteroidales bacterium]